ncbi:acyltransferase family protein [Amaricoccus solimangrovi]|uniref:Acyltransferase n=1 Tax=Amaricoccus solimangrovi TaxID=2589815 RepID=A0A501WWT9_9RHOB|nr:acyltransferase [Amaricoccus solimangrovi]TPE53192.1 acyltransferase [Amaricoccus solimangrovi]
MSGETAERLPGLDAGRALAAIGVVFFHANNYFLPVVAIPGEDAGSFWRLGQHGVEFFFVLSGFLVLLRHRRGDRGEAVAAAFLLGRARRLLPLYWTVLACVALGIALAPAFGLHLGAGRLSAERLLASLVPLPGAEEPVLRVAWTLGREALFYMLFALVLLRPARFRPLFLGWMAASGLTVFMAPPAPLDAVLSPFDLCFGLGMLAALARERLPAGAAAPLATLGLAIVLAGAAGEMTGPGWGEAARVAIFGPGSALLVLVLAMARRVPRMLVALGRGSFAIYLVHGSALALVAPAARRLPGAAALPPAAMLALLTGTAVAAGMLVHRLVEGPLVAAARARPSGRAAPAETR